MGAVYEATLARLAGRYARKLLLLKPTVGLEAIALFAREARGRGRDNAGHRAVELTGHFIHFDWPARGAKPIRDASA